MRDEAVTRVAEREGDARVCQAREGRVRSTVLVGRRRVLGEGRARGMTAAEQAGEYFSDSEVRI